MDSKNSVLYGIYGASGFGREILPVLRQQLAGAASSEIEIMFIDDAAADTGDTVNGVRLVSFDAFVRLPQAQKYITIAIANSVVRQKLSQKVADHKIQNFDIRANSVEIYDEVEIGCGSILCAKSILTSNIKIGKFFHSNIYSYVAHDCIIGDFVTFAPQVQCNGNVHIGDHAYIGTGAILRQGSPEKPLKIGSGAVIGMGAVVTKDVPAGEVWVGNPACKLER